MGANIVVLFISFLSFVAVVSQNVKEPITAALTLKCLNGFKLAEKKCIKKEIVQTITKCPKYSKMLDRKSMFYDYINGKLKLSELYELADKKKNLNTTTIPVKFECPPNYQYVSSNNEVKDNCIKETYYKPYNYCPEGFKISHDDVCFRPTHGKASVMCPTGYNPDRKGCFTTEKVSSVFTCPKHYTLKGDGNCVKKKKENVCPNGYVMVTTKAKEVCRKVFVRDALPICPNGTVMDDKTKICLINTEAALRLICNNRNYTNIKSKYIDLIKENNIDCSSNSKFDGKQYTKKFVIQPEFKCNESEKLVNLNKCESIVEVPLVDCTKEIIKQADIACPDGAKMVQNECEKIIHINNQKICGNKGELRYNKCISYEQDEHLMMCKKGELTNNSMCVIRKIVDMVATCDKGFKLSDDKKKCEKLLYRNFSIVDVANTTVKGEKCVDVKVKKDIIVS